MQQGPGVFPRPRAIAPFAWPSSGLYGPEGSSFRALAALDRRQLSDEMEQRDTLAAAALAAGRGRRVKC